MLENDRALLDAFRRGERDAMARVFRHHVDDMARTLRAGVLVEVNGRQERVGQNLPDHEIEALVQETFTRAFSPQARQSYDGLRPFGAWLSTIARNLLVDRARREQRAARAFKAGQDVLADQPTHGRHDPVWTVESHELRGLVEKMKGTLQEPDAQIFALRFEQQKSVRETAEMLGITEIVVRRRETRQRVQLLALLRSSGFLENARVRIGTSLLRRSDKQTR